MNPGETRPRETDEGELGDALQDRLSRLAARLERLTSNPDALTESVGKPMADAQLASDAFADEDQGEPIPPPRPAARRPSRAEQPAPQNGKQEKAGLAEIAAALRNIEQTEPPAAAHEPRPAARDHAGAEKRLQSIRQRIDALKSRHIQKDARQEIEPEPAEPEETRQPEPPPEPLPQRNRTAEFNAAVAEIAARQRDIDGATSPMTTRPAEMTRPAPRPRPASSPNQADAQRPPEPARFAEGPRSALTEATRLSPAELERQLVNIQEQLQASPKSGDITALAAGNQALVERVDRLLARSPEPGFEAFAQEIVHRVPSSDRFDSLITEIDRLSERIGGMGGREDLARLEARMMGLYEQLASNDHASRLEAEVTSVRDSVVPAIERLEQRLSQISERIDASVGGPAHAEDTANLLTRLEKMARRGEAAPEALEALASEIAGLRARERSELANLDNHIQALAKRLDEAILGQANGEVAIAEFDSRLSALSERLDELARHDPSVERSAALEQVEAQVHDLAARFEQIETSEHSGAGLADLEAQVAVLMERLELLASDHDTLREVQQNLARVEGRVSSADAQSMETIRRAAEEAVSELSGVASGANARIVEELRADLRELQAAQNRRPSAEGLDQIHQTLDRVIARLGNLEAEFRGRGDRAEAPAPAAEAPEPAQTLRRRADRANAEEELLAPGSNRPRSEAKPDGDRDRRADFIAAARRAAQAAAAEHGAIRRALPGDEEEAVETVGRGSRFRSFIGDNKRPLLLAVGAIVLAIAAFQIAKPFFASTAQETPPSESANVAPEPVVIDPAIEVPTDETPPVIVIDPPPIEPIPAPEPPVIETPAVEAPPAATETPAFMPPAGVTSPVNTPAEEVTGVGETTYPMPDVAIGGVRLRVAASEGDPAALYEVGARYADGVGVTRDLEQAALWLERSAETGLAVAQHRLGAMYEAGLGVPEDREIALEWYLAAAEQGNVLAMHNIGVMFSQGISGTPDFAAAIDWFTLAADHGIRDSQYNLGVIYARGIGVDPDLVAAYKWFALAAAQGDSDAAARRDDVAATLSPEDLAGARASVSAWSIQTAPASANMVDVPEGGWDAPEERAEVLDEGELVRTIQALLADRGFDPGPADGVIGPMTRDAARAFQQAIGIPATGVLDEVLLDALAEEAA